MEDFGRMLKSFLQYFSYSSSIINSARESEGTIVCSNNNGNSSIQNPHSSAYTNQVILENRDRKEMPFIPEEIIFKIFLLLPAKVLHDVMRTVCRTWRKVIRDPDFIKAHLSQSPITPFCLAKSEDYFEFYFINKDPKIKNQQKINHIYLTHGDGFILTTNDHNEYARSIIHLINPLTKQIVTLPCLPGDHRYRSSFFAVGCSHSTLEVKVILNRRYSTYILTVGVDKEWRKILVESNTKTSMPLHALCYAQGIWGFIYWYYIKGKYIVALDVENEVFYKADMPEELRGRYMNYTSSDRFLSFAFEHEFWELVDCKNGGEWRKIGKVDFEIKRSELNDIMRLDISDFSRENISPVAVLKSRDVAIFRIGEPNFVYIYFTYNFKTGTFLRWFDFLRDDSRVAEFQHVNLRNDSRVAEFQHVNSLVML